MEADAYTALPNRRPATAVAHDWVTTVDHKQIGILYIVASCFFLTLGGVEASVDAVAIVDARSGDRQPANVQPIVHDARHDDDLFRRDAGRSGHG